jgi:hypothetical protein
MVARIKAPVTTSALASGIAGTVRRIRIGMLPLRDAGKRRTPSVFVN